jgi:hypothetical protein
VKDSSHTITITRSQACFVSWVADVLVYIVVLTLFVEWAPAVVIESFTVSILTAIALKALLDLIIGFEHRVNAFSRTSGSLGSWPPC